MPSPTSHTLRAQSLPMHYLDWGNTDAPTLILVHGGMDHAHSWDWLAEPLSARWHVVAPDLRGHGDSAWSPDGAYHLALYVDDLASLMHALGQQPVRLVGHSLGGAICVRFAALYPALVHRLVAIEGLGLANPSSHPVDQRWRRWIEVRRILGTRGQRRYPSLAEAEARMQAANSRLTAAQVHHLTLHGTIRLADGGFVWKFDPRVRARLPLDVTDDELRALWGRIECPTLLVGGTESWAASPTAGGRAACFRKATVAVFDGAGHWPHHEQLHRFSQAMDAFL